MWCWFHKLTLCQKENHRSHQAKKPGTHRAHCTGGRSSGNPVIRLLDVLRACPTKSRNRGSGSDSAHARMSETKWREMEKDVVLLEDSGGKILEEFLLEERHEALLRIDARGKITTCGHKFVRAVGVEPCRQMSRLKMLKHKRAYNSYKETSIKSPLVSLALNFAAIRRDFRTFCFACLKGPIKIA